MRWTTLMTPVSRSTADLLPLRYHTPWRAPFEQRIAERLSVGTHVLDIGSGRHPAVPSAQRPSDVHYVGLDLSATELAEAGPGAYSETVAADATALQAGLVDRFDLAVSWQVLEHVRDLRATYDSVYAYLRPGGTFVALFSGTFSAFGLINKALPHVVAKRIVEPIMHRREANTPVFPAYYNHCYASALKRILEPWSTVEIVPLYAGATYFMFFRPLLRSYLAYENTIARRERENLATHYLVTATR